MRTIGRTSDATIANNQLRPVHNAANDHLAPATSANLRHLGGDIIITSAKDVLSGVCLSVCPLRSVCFECTKVF